MDDPFVPIEPFRAPAVTGNPHLIVLECPHGGHCGFVGRSTGDDDGYWAERQVIAFLAAHDRR